MPSTTQNASSVLYPKCLHISKVTQSEQNILPSREAIRAIKAHPLKLNVLL